MTRRKPRTWRRYAMALVVWLNFLAAVGRHWTEATPQDVEAFKDWRLTDVRNPERIKPGSFDTDRAALNTFYTWASGAYALANAVPSVPPAEEDGQQDEEIGPKVAEENAALKQDLDDTKAALAKERGEDLGTGADGRRAVARTGAGPRRARTRTTGTPAAGARSLRLPPRRR